MKTKETCETQKKKRINFSWKYKKNRLDSSTILINGILFTCIILSIASGFIDLTFFSGLSKSLFHVGTIPIPAAVLYTVISIGFILAKFWCAMQIGMIKELRTRLFAKGKDWANGLKKALLPWQIVHKFLIAVSIITALSLSVNSIGAGIRKMEQNIKNMSYDAEQLLELQHSVRDGNKDMRDASKENISGQTKAQQNVAKDFDEKWKYVKDYRAKRDTLNVEKESADEERAKQIEEEILKLKKEAVNLAPEGVNSNNIDWVEEYTIKNKLLENAKKFETIDATSSIQDGINFDKNEIESTIKALADKEYRTPDGELISFTNEDGSLVDVQLAISRLQNGISEWQSDTGDVGESSKIFTLIATYINADAKAGGMGISEWMLMILIALFGIVQEFLIYLFTPKATIDRKLLSQVSSYMMWKDEEEKERFLISVYKSYVGDGIINQENYEAKCKKCVSLMQETEDDVIAKWSKKEVKPKEKKEFSNKVDNSIKEIEEMLK